MASKKKSTVQSRVKKKWVPIYAPSSLNHSSLGESYVADSSQLEGRSITANMSTITGNMRKNSINMQFKVMGVKDGNAETRTVGYSMINSAIKRLVKRGRDKIPDSFLTKTKDKEVIRVKPLVITTNKGTKSVQSAIRLEARRIIREYSFTVDAETLFSDIFNGKIQKMLKEKCVKFSPLKSVDIRMAKLEENTKVVVTDDAVKTETVKRRVKDVEGKRHVPDENLESEESESDEEKSSDESSEEEKQDSGEEQQSDAADSEDFEDESEDTTQDQEEGDTSAQSSEDATSEKDSQKGEETSEKKHE